MARYIVKRTAPKHQGKHAETSALGSLTDANRSSDDVVWEHSHVVADADGRRVAYCIFEAPSTARLLEHVSTSRGPIVDEVFEIGADLGPSDLAS